MTETTLGPTTERVVDLARRYFDSVGATVRHTDQRVIVDFEGVTPPEWVERYCDGRRLVVTIPDRAGESTAGEASVSGSTGGEASASGSTGGEASVSGSTAGEASAAGDGKLPSVGPETAFTRRLIDAAAAHCPVGAASVTGVPGGAETLVPEWLRESPGRVASATFYPYYDAQVVCVWLRAEIETPSQFQRESLHTVVVDTETGDRVDCDPTALLDAAETGGDGAGESAVERALETARSHVVAALDTVIDRVETEAGRAAATAFAEYVDGQRSRLSERRAERDRVETELATVAERLVDATGDDRVDLLERRERLTERRDALDTELSALETAESKGFPEERSRLRRRHTVAVRTRPVAVTTVAVERGDLSLEVVGDGGRRATLDFSAGAASGLRRTPSCPDCGREFGPQNGLCVTDAGLACVNCRDG